MRKLSTTVAEVTKQAINSESSKIEVAKDSCSGIRMAVIISCPTEGMSSMGSTWERKSAKTLLLPLT
jgi:hypothetical protein